MDARSLARSGGVAMSARVIVLPGDGVGPEVTAQALSVLELVCDQADIDLHVREMLIGGRAVDETNSPLPDDTLAACKEADAVLFGACGGPRWDHLRGEQRCEQGLLRLRRGMDVFANLRPVRVHSRLSELSPVRPAVVRGTDLAAALPRRRVTRPCTRRRRWNGWRAWRSVSPARDAST